MSKAERYGNMTAFVIFQEDIHDPIAFEGIANLFARG